MGASFSLCLVELTHAQKTKPNQAKLQCVVERTLDILVFRSSCGYWTELATTSPSELKDLFPWLLGGFSAERSP